jgi:hypothetical protein
MFPDEDGSGRKDIAMLSILKNEWIEREKEKLRERLIK